MILNTAKSVMLGNKPVKKIMFGCIQVWPEGDRFLNLNPDIIWLTEANNFTEVVNVVSNTQWSVKQK